MAGPWVSDQINTFEKGLTGGTASAGISGAPTYPRGTEVRQNVKVYRFTFNLAAPNPTPGVPTGSVANGDTIILAILKVTDRIIFGRFYEVATWGAGVTLSVGKQDTNNSANTDAAHYIAASSMAAAAGTSYDLNLNMGEQVGADPTGDLTVGNTLPSFGSGPIYITATVGGGTPNATGSLNGYLLVTEEGA